MARWRLLFSQCMRDHNFYLGRSSRLVREPDRQTVDPRQRLIRAPACDAPTSAHMVGIVPPFALADKQPTGDKRNANVICLANGRRTPGDLPKRLRRWFIGTRGHGMASLVRNSVLPWAARIRPLRGAVVAAERHKIARYHWRQAVVITTPPHRLTPPPPARKALWE